MHAVQFQHTTDITLGHGVTTGNLRNLVLPTADVTVKSV